MKKIAFASRRQLLKAAAAGCLSLMRKPAFAGAPIKIGFGMSLTGPNAGGGKPFLLGREIWKDEVNAKGGLLNRPVEFVYYDDQSNPSLVPAIYSKLLDLDKVDLVISPFGTNQITPAMHMTTTMIRNIPNPALGLPGLPNGNLSLMPKFKPNRDGCGMLFD